MPLVRISLLRGRSADTLAALSAAVQGALVAHFDVPEDDCFQVIQQLAPGELVVDRNYLGGPRSDGFVLIEITAGRVRPAALKRRLYRALADSLDAAAGIQPEDVMVVIGTTGPEDWSFGGGRAAIDAGARQ